MTIWLENTDYDKAFADPNLQWLASQGISVNNYFGVTHPSMPNYIAAIGGDTFGCDNDDFKQIDANVSTLIDLLEDKGISWSSYQEDMPYSGFEGKAYVNQQTKSNDYVRKHNPPVIFDATHAVQLPGGAGTASSGQRQYVGALSRAAVAVGIDGLFWEVHENPEVALCDGPNSLYLKDLRGMLQQIMAIDALVKSEENRL